MDLRKGIFGVITVVFFSAGCLYAQDRLTRQQYIEKYITIAIEEMEIYGIPASITMAQGLFESDNGNSRLAREANNHFGIKCKAEWTGPTIAHDDDAVDECFRAYASAEESFRDHSEFIDKGVRYQDLFKLEPTDYKGWAEGLKAAGYATNPLYATQLIKIIEDNQLHLLDQGNAPMMAVVEETTIIGVVPVAPEVVARPGTGTVDVDNYVVSTEAAGPNYHTVYSNNGSRFVVVREGDNYGSIAAEFRMKINKIMKLNDLPAGAPLNTGDMVYIKAKNKRSENGKLIHIAKDGETMHSISQMYGIKLKNLYNINRRPKDSPVKAGQQIRLM